MNKYNNRLSKYNIFIKKEANIYTAIYKDKTYQNTSISKLYKELKTLAESTPEPTINKESVRKSKALTVDVNNKDDLRKLIGKRITIERKLYNKHTSIIKGLVVDITDYIILSDNGAGRVIAPYDIISLKVN